MMKTSTAAAAPERTTSTRSRESKCVCSWKNCHVYQKFFRNHPTWDGVIKLRFVNTDPEAMALKESIDRNLRVGDSKAQDWKTSKSGSGDHKTIKYNIACHHWTELHIRRYRDDPENYSFLKPFSAHGAKKYLAKVDPAEAISDPDNSKNGELRYLQSPLVSNREVKALFYELKEELENGGGSNERGVKRADSGTVSTNPSTQGSTDALLLREKEVENKHLKDQLEAMQSQLSFLHDMVSKLQEERHDHHSSTTKSHSGRTSSGHRRYRSGGSAAGSSRRTGSRSSRSSVPHEIEIESEDDGDWIEPVIDEEQSGDLDEDLDDDDTRSHGTFMHANPGASSIRRGNSFSSRASRASRATSIVSASKSIKSLPHEIQFIEDDDSDESPEEQDLRPSSHSVSRSRQQQSQQSRRYSESGGSRGSDPSILSGIYQVTALTVKDPYGERGTYTGSISNSTGMPHGFGRLEYDKAGRWYEGDWRHGRWTGHGRLSNGDGDYYEGGLKSDHKHGRGIMRFADGRVFEGEYRSGQMVEGKMTYQDGSTYTGGWIEGMRHGRGLCVFTDKSVYEGEFQEGEFCGIGKMSWSDGGWYEGDWMCGEMHGYGKEIRPDGSLRHEGQWAKGQPIRK